MQSIYVTWKPVCENVLKMATFQSQYLYFMIPTSHMPHQRRKKAPFYPKTVLHITQLIWSIAAFLPVCMKEKCVVDIQVHCFQFISDWGNELWFWSSSLLVIKVRFSWSLCGIIAKNKTKMEGVIHNIKVTRLSIIGIIVWSSLFFYCWARWFSVSCPQLPVKYIWVLSWM